MRIGNVRNRLTVLVADGTVDVATTSGNRFDSDPQAIYERWDEFVVWARDADLTPTGPRPKPEQLGPPTPRPRQVVAIGLNYSDHAAESGFETPDEFPPTFTKFPTCITGPVADIVLPPGGHTDFEVELVAVMGRAASGVSREDAWSFVAGLAVGQDLSERITQMAGPSPQFSLGKSYPGFGPIGPWLVTPDEFDHPEDLELGCSINGELMQKGRTKDLIFPVPVLIEKLSAVITLLPGDVIFTGTPSGVGLGRTPPRWLADGDELVSYVEGIGELRHRFAAAP